jgi:hypothetical protein
VEAPAPTVAAEALPPAPAPAPPPAPEVVKRDWCATSNGQELYADGTGVIACHRPKSEWDRSPIADPACARFDLAGGAPKPATRPARPTYAHATVRDHEVCDGKGTCKAFGPNLLAEVREARAGKMGNFEPALDATLDGRTVVVMGHPWNVAADRRLPLKPAGHYAKEPQGAMVSTTVIENLLVNDWFACAGPCHEVQLTTSAGVPIGPALGGYPLVFRASADLFVLGADGSPVMDEKEKQKVPAQTHVYDVRTGLRRMTLTPALGIDAVVAVGGDVVVLRSGTPFKLQRISGGRKSEWKVPTCPES